MTPLKPHPLHALMAASSDSRSSVSRREDSPRIVSRDLDTYSSMLVAAVGHEREGRRGWAGRSEAHAPHAVSKQTPDAAAVTA